MIGRDEIHSLFKDRSEEILKFRRHLHQYPELSFQEFKTSQFIQNKLKEAGIPFQVVAETGIIAEILGRNPEKKTIVLRGDIDALPIQENTGLEFASQNEGVMHACGHDVHTTCVMAAGLILNELKDRFEGKVRLLFQPGEEKLPGGASIVIATGKLDEPKPDLVIGQHVFAELEVGKVGFRPGLYMASADEIYVDVKGPGGHAAMPEKTVDVLKVASQLILALKDFVDENKPSEYPSVLTFGKIEGKGATNVIPKLVHIEGTFRTMDEEWRAEVHQKLVKISADLAAKSGAEIVMDVRKGYPCLVNNEEATLSSKAAAQEFLGKDNVIDLDIRMTAEDFAYYTQRYKSCFYRLGIRSEGAPVTGLHTPDFFVDEKALEVGSELMAYLALKNLS